MKGFIGRGFLAVALLCSVGSLSATSFAQTDQERAAAREAAKDGIKAFTDGKYEEALEYLERAESVVHAPTHLLFIARARVKVGKYVEAREAYKKILSENLSANAPKAFQNAQEVAQEEIDGLDGKIGKVSINVKGPDGVELNELVVKIDGQLVPNTLIGLSVPTNPGEREVTATARGMLPSSERVTVEEGGRTKVELTLAVDESAPAEVPAADDSEGKPAESAATAEVAPDAGRSSQATWGWISTGAGAALVGTGAVFGILSSSQLSDARDDDALCGSDNECTEAGWTEVDAAQTKALIADISMGVGIAAVGVGIFLLVTADKPKETVGVRSIVPSADQHGGYLTLQGGF